jgi:hypothetical protein
MIINKEAVQAAQLSGVSEGWILSSIAIGKITLEEAKWLQAKWRGNTEKDFKPLIYKHNLSFKEAQRVLELRRKFGLKLKVALEVLRGEKSLRDAVALKMSNYRKRSDQRKKPEAEKRQAREKSLVMLIQSIRKKTKSVTPEKLRIRIKAAYQLWEKLKPDAVGAETEQAIAYLLAPKTIALFQELQRQKLKQKKASEKAARFFGRSLSTAKGRIPIDRVAARVVR